MRAFSCHLSLGGARRGGGNINRSSGLVHIEETHAITRLEKRTGITVYIPHLHRCGADDLPAAGAILRIDAAEGASQRHRTRRNAGTRALPARHVKSRIAANQITEAGRETAEGHGEFAFGMAADDFVDAHAGQFGNVGQILAVIMDGDFHQIVRGRDFCGEIAAGKPRNQRLCANLFGAETDHQGAGSRNRFVDALDRIVLKRGEQRQRFIEIGKFDENGGEADGEKAHHILTRDRQNRECR